MPEVERLGVPDGISRVRLEGSTVDENGYLISIHGGRIKLLLRVRRLSQSAYAWRIDSPHLSGYYQEIKTVWRPTFILSDDDKQISALLYNGEFGNLYYKTPQDGLLQCPDSWSECHLSFSIFGYFDQSDMAVPVLRKMSWSLDDAAASNITLHAP